MLNRSFKQIEEFTHTVLTETCCPRLLLACGCLKISCVCCFVNPQYYISPAVCLDSVRKKIDFIHQIQKPGFVNKWWLYKTRTVQLQNG